MSASHWVAGRVRTSQWVAGRVCTGGRMSSTSGGGFAVGRVGVVAGDGVLDLVQETRHVCGSEMVV